MHRQLIIVFSCLVLVASCQIKENGVLELSSGAIVGEGSTYRVQPASVMISETITFTVIGPGLDTLQSAQTIYLGDIPCHEPDLVSVEDEYFSSGISCQFSLPAEFQYRDGAAAPSLKVSGQNYPGVPTFTYPLKLSPQSLTVSSKQEYVFSIKNAIGSIRYKFFPQGDSPENYEWLDSNDDEAPVFHTTSGLFRAPSSNGFYQLMIKDQSNNESTALVNVATTLQATFERTGSSVDEPVSLFVEGGEGSYSYIVLSGSAQLDKTSDGVRVTPLNEGMIQIRVVDGHGNFKVVSLDVFPPFRINAPSRVKSFDHFQLGAQGGKPPYSFHAREGKVSIHSQTGLAIAQSHSLSYSSLFQKTQVTVAVRDSLGQLRFTQIGVVGNDTPRGYADVGIIINTRNPESVYAGKKFAHMRGLPEENLIYIDTSSEEIISPEEFDELRSQIEERINRKGLQKKLNYLITTKGVPLKIQYEAGSDVFSVFSPNTRSASVDAELALILGPYAESIGKAASIQNPYYRKTGPFSRAIFGIFLVTRLDAYDIDLYLGHLNRISERTWVNKQIARFVFDIAPSWNQYLPQLNIQLTEAAGLTSTAGFQTTLDQTTAFLRDQQNVLGYASWGSNDIAAAQNSLLNYQWLAGSIANTYVSTSGRSFKRNAGGVQSLIADILGEGASGAIGFVYEPYTFAMIANKLLFNAYLDGFNYAESVYGASPTLSWMSVMIGDPKMQIKTRE